MSLDTQDKIDDVFADILRRVREYNPDANFDLIQKAYLYANHAHRPQVRVSGEPYIYHPLEVARILTGLRMDSPSLAAAILHDVIEDTGTSKDQVIDLFGQEVAELVDGVTKLSAITGKKGDSVPALKGADAQAENLRKIFLAMAKDIRVIIVKLADRLHNLRTLGSMPEAKRKSVAAETLEIYTPIASRLGLWQIKPEMEDLSFKYLYPEEYEEVATVAGRLRARREKAIAEVLAALKSKLGELNIKANIEWRPKHLYSIWKKMGKGERSIDEVYDLIAVRIIVDSQEDCYTTLGAVHSLWMPIKDRIKDYIAVPKSNRYRSLHTTVYGPGNEPFEIQIRTWEMHRINEFGIAAHWAYKQGHEYNKDMNLAQDIYPWIKLILDWQDESKDAREYIENLKLDLLTTEVFVFTPLGDVVDLPAGSTPLDFAYRIHTNVGHKCTGARVNTKMVPLDYTLQNADIVEVITNKNATPSLDWLRLCKSSHARNKIRAWFKKERREENIAWGKDSLERELKRQRIDDKLMSDADVMTKVAKALNYVTSEDMLAALGYSEINIAQVMGRLKEVAPERFPQKEPPKAPVLKKRKSPLGVSVTGMGDLLVKFSRCCNPVHGDDIAGFVSLGKGVVVHRSNCRNYTSQIKGNPERAIEVHWEDTAESTTYPVDLEVDAMDRVGLLTDVMMVLNDSRIPTRSCKAWARKDRAMIKLSVDIVHKQQLDDLMKRIGRLKGVLSVDRAASAR
jgi:GTP pyrophosphokinase